MYTKGSCSFSENGSFISEEFNTHFSNSNTNVRELIKAFELETILIYTALLLKKKIIVYHHSVEQLLKWIETFPALMTHHRVSSYLRPWVDLVEDELIELKVSKQKKSNFFKTIVIIDIINANFFFIGPSVLCDGMHR